MENWIGRAETSEDTITPELLSRFQATLEGLVPLPNPAFGLHWCLAQPTRAAAELGRDGHPAKGGFLPPIPLPQRMWAGGKITFHALLPINTPIRKTSRIASITHKDGARGPLAFVDVAHRFEAAGLPLISEIQTIVYRSPGPAAEAKPAPLPKHHHTLQPDSTLLFRYSALTFNGHRIHYDFPYATQVEGYEGLVVHGPLIATLLANLSAAENPAARLHSFAYRGISPAVSGHALHLVSSKGGTALQAHGPDGTLVMTATVQFT